MSAWLVAGDAAQGGLRALAIVVAHGAVLAVGTAALLWLLGRRAGPALAAALWTVVLAKFVLPVGPALPWSLSDLLARVLARPAAAPLAPDEALVPIAGVARATAAPAASTAVWLLAVGALALALSVVAVAVARLVGLVRAHRRAFAAARALPIAAPTLRAEVAAAAAQLRVRPPEVRVDHAGASPRLVGVRRPILIVPAGLDGDAARAAVLGHELAHLRRRDPWIAAAQAVVVAALGWIPVVRFAARRLDAAREAACDAWALEHAALPATAYARLLVRYARGPAPLAAGMHLAATPGALRARVDALLDGAPRPRLGARGVLVLAPWAVLGLAGSRTDAAAPPPGAEVCLYSPARAETLYAAHPEADADGDGTLSQLEVCDFEADVRRRLIDDAVPAAAFDAAFDADADGALDATEDAAMRAALAAALSDETVAAASPLLAETACCNCLADGGTSPAVPTVLAPSPGCSEGESP